MEVVEGPDAGLQLPLDRPIEVGRQPGATLLVHDDLVSRHHARITPTRGGATVEDLGSTNGTFVNGNEVHGPTFASAGDQILVGVTVVQLRTAQQVADRPSAVRQAPPALRVDVRHPDYLPPDLQRAAPPPPPAGAPRGAGAGAAAAPAGLPGTAPAAPVGRPPGTRDPQLDPLLDVHTKRLALLAPLVILVVATLAVIAWLALR